MAAGHLPTGISFIALEALTGTGSATEPVVVGAPFRARPTSCAPGRVLYSGFPACLASCLFVVLAKVVVLFVGLFVMFVKYCFVCVFVYVKLCYPAVRSLFFAASTQYSPMCHDYHPSSALG